MAEPQVVDAPEARTETRVDGRAASADTAGGSVRGLAPVPAMVLRLQRQVGNARTVAALRRTSSPAPAGATGAPLAVQRCGGEVHEGCACAEEAAAQTPVQTLREPAVQRFTDGTPDAPSPDLPDGSPYFSLHADLRATLGRTLTAKSFWRWANGKPTNLGAALDMLGAPDVNTLVQLHSRMATAGLWAKVTTITALWSTSSLGIDFTEDGSMQAAVEGGNFCKDDSIGQIYHSGKQCWREMVESGTPGLHACFPGSIHIDPHQTVASFRGPGIEIGWSGVGFRMFCFYNLLSVVGHMMDVEGGRPVNVFIRESRLRERVEPTLARIAGQIGAHPELGSHQTAVAAVPARLDAIRPILRRWSLQGLEGGDGTPEVGRVTAELQSVENVLDAAKNLLDDLAEGSMPQPLPMY